MKKIFKIVGILTLNVMLLSTTCFASENSLTVPKEIVVDNGKLELIGVGDNDVNGVQPRYVYKVVTDGGNLNVRSGPGTNYSIIGQIANGSYVNISFMQDANISPWVYGSGTSTTGVEITGYMHGDYIGTADL